MTQYDIDENWSMLLSKLSPEAVTFAEFYEHDTVYESYIVPGFKNAPAAKGIHHAYLGGLVKHILECFEYLQMLHPMFPSADYEAVKEAVFLHDIHKAFYHYSYTPFADKPNGQLAYLDHALTKLYTPNQKTMLMITGSIDGSPVYKISPKVHHILNCSEGGWAENAPKESSVDAKLAYLIDEMSVLHDRCAQNNLDSIYPRQDTWRSFVTNDSLKRI